MHILECIEGSLRVSSGYLTHNRSCIWSLHTETRSIEWLILNTADMTIDSKGNKVAVTQRLQDIKERYGEQSNQYLTACDVAYTIGLTAVNLAETK